MKVTTGKFRVSYAQVFTPRAIEEGQEPKYSLTMLFDKDDPALDPLKKAAKDAAHAKWGDKVPKNIRNPFRDGDEDSDQEAYKDKIFIRVSSKSKPGLVDKDRNAILEAEDFYSGCYARATVNSFAYDTAGNKGVSFGLNNIQKLADGERLDNRTAAEDDFDDYTGSTKAASETDDDGMF